ncbi:hypothetical protein BVC80_9047g75 [Macleaya cordata]|uniref:LOB domain-containing protein n=1 Tax=Macleaya cordata TaxID=56857 RepID=A0A200R323_MACCD|nr:hypothetical protein BVC80_9047g75 [Macleaya cordata]
MSCNGCRVLRKGCSEACILRPCLQWIDSPEAQGHATVFVAKFFGRAGLMSFISAVPENQRPALFQSLLFEACGRTVNPVNGAVGLLSTGNWHVCQAAVETVFRGGILRPISVVLGGTLSPESDEASELEFECTDHHVEKTRDLCSRSKDSKRKRFEDEVKLELKDLNLSLTPLFPKKVISNKIGAEIITHHRQQPPIPSMTSAESTDTTYFDCKAAGDHTRTERNLLNLFL